MAHAGRGQYLVLHVVTDTEQAVNLQMDVAMARSAFWTKSSKGTLGMCRIASQGLVDLLVYNNVDLNATFSCTLQDMIQTPVLGGEGRSAQEEFWRQPPVLDVDGFLCSFQCDRDGVEVVTAVNVPLDLVSISLGRETLEAMAFGDSVSLLVGRLFVFFVVTVIGVDQVLPLADLVLRVDCLDLDDVAGLFLQLVPEISERRRDMLGGTLVLCISRVASLLRRVNMRRLSNKSHPDV